MFSQDGVDLALKPQQLVRGKSFGLDKAFSVRNSESVLRLASPNLPTSGALRAKTMLAVIIAIQVSFESSTVMMVMPVTKDKVQLCKHT